MSRSHLPFVDWMKCLGMLVIVYGHVAAGSVEGMAPPIRVKQLGVAFFLFVTGYTLSGDTRPAGRVLFNRLFEVFLFGIACAVLMSGIGYVRSSHLALSNYLPFLLGVNVVFDHFPANPTTWYIGTYLHVLLIWALVLRGRRIRAWVLVAAAVGEILVRAALVRTAGLFVAYMLFSNWATVFLLGLYCGQRRNEPSRAGLAPYLLGLCVLAVAWPLMVGGWVGKDSFPFMRFEAGSSWAGLALTSAAVTTVYVLFTWLVYEVTRRLWVPSAIGFLARNTLLVFIAHMPVYYALVPAVEERLPSYWGRVAIWFVACYPMLAVASEIVRRLVRPVALRDRVWRLLGQEGGAKSLGEVRAVVGIAPTVRGA
jgi:hypothetical protein